MKEINRKKAFIKTAHNFEHILSIVILLVVALGIMDILRMIYEAYIVDFANPVEYDQLNQFLAQILLMVIGIELVIMLSLHLPGTLLEVLLYAIARKLLLLPKSSGAFELFLGVLSIAVIFAIKKYLMTKEFKPAQTSTKEERKESEQLMKEQQGSII